MIRKGFFRVQEIGVSEQKFKSFISLKGRKKLFLREQQFLRSMLVTPQECWKEVVQISEGIVGDEAQFVRNVFRLARKGIREAKIEMRKGYVTSTLRFSDGSRISGVDPSFGLMYTLACEGNIYCHKDLHEGFEKFMEFRNVEEIKLKDRKTEVVKDEYTQLDIDRTYCHNIPPFWLPDSIVYKKGEKRYSMSVPLDKATIQKASSDHSVRPERIKVQLDNPAVEMGSITLVNHIMMKANIKVDSIYIDATPKRRKSGNIHFYNPIKAVITLKKDEQEIVTSATGNHAIAQSYLKSKGIWFKDIAKQQSRTYVS